MKIFGKIFSFLAAVVCLTSPFDLSASSQSKSIAINDVIGTYQVSGFSNSFTNQCNPSDSALVQQPGLPQSVATVGQFTFNPFNVGNINFIDLTFIDQSGMISTEHFENVGFTYNLGPLNGYGTLTLVDFPAVGQNEVFALSFKRRCQKVVGFSAVLTQTPGPVSFLWLLLQGERF